MKRALAALLLLSAWPALAWGPEGHRIVGEIAAEHLTPTAQAAVARLLAGEPEPTLPGVANWADETRTPETGPLHYVNMPKGDCHYTPQRDCPGGHCVVGGIEHAVAVLKNPGANADEQRIALKNLVHFVGDVHQPLHAGLAEDRGGNSVKLHWHDKESNLHRLWDSDLITQIEPDWQRYAARLAPLAPRTDLVTLDPADWAIASCTIAQSPGFYPDASSVGEPYLMQWRGTVDQELNFAGLRLAAWLNVLLDR